MKKFYLSILLILIIFFFNSCAKPKVVKIFLPEDENLNCKQLKNAVAETQKIKKDAEYEREGTGANVARMTLFWPAWARSLHNADVAIRAANDRNYHLVQIMKKKNCKDAESINFQLNETTNTNTNTNTNVSIQLKTLKEMYDSGDITQEEYIKAKKKTLD